MSCCCCISALWLLQAGWESCPCCELVGSECVLRSGVLFPPKTSCLSAPVAGNLPWQMLVLFCLVQVCQKEEQKSKTPQLGDAAQLQAVPALWLWAFAMQLLLSALLFKAELSSWQPFWVMWDYGEGNRTGGGMLLVLGSLHAYICTELCKKNWTKSRSYRGVQAYWTNKYIFFSFLNIQNQCNSVCSDCCNNRTNQCCYITAVSPCWWLSWSNPPIAEPSVSLLSKH